MPYYALDYADTKIYKLCCKDPEIKEIYVSYTTNIPARKRYHKLCLQKENIKSYFDYVNHFIRENGGWNNWQLILIERFPCKEKMEAEARCHYWVNELNATLNKSLNTEREEQEIERENKTVEYMKEDYRRNLAKLTGEYVCQCGKTCWYMNKTKHFKSKKHIEFMAQNEIMKD
jgi:hypothetical protein